MLVYVYIIYIYYVYISWIYWRNIDEILMDLPFVSSNMENPHAIAVEIL